RHRPRLAVERPADDLEAGAVLVRRGLDERAAPAHRDPLARLALGIADGDGVEVTGQITRWVHARNSSDEGEEDDGNPGHGGRSVAPGPAPRHHASPRLGRRVREVQTEGA